MKRVKLTAYVLLSSTIVGCSAVRSSVDELSQVLGTSASRTDDLLKPLSSKLGNTTETTASSVRNWLIKVDGEQPGTISRAQNSVSSGQEFLEFINEARCELITVASEMVSAPSLFANNQDAKGAIIKLELSSPADAYPGDAWQISKIRQLHEAGLPITNQVLEFADQVCF